MAALGTLSLVSTIIDQRITAKACKESDTKNMALITGSWSAQGPLGAGVHRRMSVQCSAEKEAMANSSSCTLRRRSLNALEMGMRDVEEITFLECSSVSSDQNLISRLFDLDNSPVSGTCNQCLSSNLQGQVMQVQRETESAISPKTAVHVPTIHIPEHALGHNSAEANSYQLSNEDLRPFSPSSNKMQKPLKPGETAPIEIAIGRASRGVVQFTAEKARLLRQKMREQTSWHDHMYHSSIASRLA